MLTVLKVQLTNFRSWVGTHEWIINQQPGLYFLTGRNHDKPRLGRNGVGKSSLLDAICFCLYGKSSRAIRGPGVVSRGHSTCVVRCTIVVDNTEFTITRKQGSPNSLKINDETVEQDAVTKKLRLNFESFLYAIVSPQSGHSFLDLSAGEKLNLFSSIMELDYWLDRSAAAAKEAEKIGLTKAVVEKRKIYLEGKATEIASLIDDFKVRGKQFEERKGEKITALTNKCFEFEAQIEILNKQIENIKMPSPADIHSLEKQIEDYESDMSELNNLFNETQKEQAIIDHKIGVLKESEQQLRQVGAFCSVCKQEVDASHIVKELQDLKDEFNKLKDERNGLFFIKQDINSNKTATTAGLAAAKGKLFQLKNEDIKADKEKSRLASEINKNEQFLKQTKADIKQTKNSINEYAQVLNIKRNELVDTNYSIEEAKAEITKLNEDFAAVHYWVAGFKKVRLFIIEDALNTLEVEVNNNLASLGMGDWKINFDAERENKSGGITKGFITLITDPKGDTVPYDTLSFGETQRVKLAGSFGLANLIMERLGLSSKFEVYDEITQHMSAEGIEDTLNILRDRAIMNGKAIVLIDHQAIEYGDFSGTINLIRDENGSRFD